MAIKQNSFDPSTHSYTLAGRPVPSVTQILNSCLPYQFKADQFYLDRGTAVHACAALIARGQAFAHDPQISGQVQAIRRFFAEVNPAVIAVEGQVFSSAFQFAGTFDLLAVHNANPTLIDWKADLDERVALQMAGYSIAHGKPEIRHGVGVEIHEDGTYTMSQVYDLRRYRSEFLAMLTVYNIKKRMGV